MSDWSFYERQLRGENPETTPGVPHQGFFRLRVRTTEYAPILGQRRNKVTVTWKPVAIWWDGGLHMQIGTEDHYRDPDFIDQIFSRCCRDAIEYDEYERMIHEHAGKNAARDSEGGCEGHGGSEEAWQG